MLKVFKFGGASIKDVESIKNIGNLIQKFSDERLVIVFSAMGKVTNMLEEVVDSYTLQNGKEVLSLDKVKAFHNTIIKGLFDKEELIFDEINNLFVEIEWIFEEIPHQGYAYNYDQIVSIGEFLSTKIMSSYLNKIGFKNTWVDARDVIKTDNTYRNAKIDWDKTTSLINKHLDHQHCLTQGFIGCTSENFTTTLGREGSDFTAAILAYSLDADEVVIWKDVPGMMNADPKQFSEAKLFSDISFDEAIELAFFGAKVIHPKTIQPLKKKNIPLKVKSFIKANDNGTLIFEGVNTIPFIPSYIVKESQVLISISDESLSFIVESHMSQIFSLLSKHSVGVNMMQNSAISFSICVDNDRHKIPKLIIDLQKDFKVCYNEGLKLYTIRHYTPESLEELLMEKTILLEQKSRNTVQIVA